MAVTGMQRPDSRTISDFRKRHLAALAGLFVQVLRLCRAAGLVKLGHVALDGTKITANASKHKAMSYDRMARAEAALAAEVKGWLAEAAAADAAEDAEQGPDQRGDELPEWVADKQARLRQPAPPNLRAIGEQDEAFQLYFNRSHERRKGAALFPEVEPPATLEEIRREIGAFAFSAQYQQNPVPPEGNRIRWEWFGQYEERRPRAWFQRVVQSWDTAVTARRPTTSQCA